MILKAPLFVSLFVLAGGFVGLAVAQTPPAAPSGIPADLTAAIEARKAELAKQQPAGAVGAPPPAGGARGGPVGPPVLATVTAPGGITITARSLSESRNASGRGSMNIQINVTGAEFQPGTMLRQATVANAVDNAGRSLLPTNPSALAGRISTSPISMSLQMGAASRGRGGPAPVQLNGSIQLSAASRNSESVKFVEGELEIYTPSEANGSIITIKDVKSRMGKPLEELTKVGVELILITPESFPPLQARVSGRPTPNFTPNSLPIFYSDPGGVLVGIVVRDGNGVALPIGGGGGGGGGNSNAMMYEYSFGSPVPPDAQLSAYILTPQAVSTVSYRLENLKLP